MSSLPPLSRRLRKFWKQDIWAASQSTEQSLKLRLFAVARIVSITLSGLKELKVTARAAALSYSSLLSLGPMIAIVVLISGLALGKQNPTMLAQGLNRAISVVVPQVTQFDRAGKPTPPKIQASDSAAAAEIAEAPPDPELVKFITNFIANSRSGTAGALGLLALLIIVIQLFSSIENTFNDIWGVRRGRSWLTRIIYYWSAITLGALLFFTSLTLFSAGAFLNLFVERVPMGAHLAKVFAWMLPSLSALLLVGILMIFYRIIPNTRVRWTAALVGALVVTGLLFLNNYFAFLYFRNVVLTKSLYGSVGILAILMVGLYVFWLFVLVGGQITYAVQNVHYRSSQTAWHNLNHATRESMSLLVLLLIARRFKACESAYSVMELSHLIHVPSQILNESLNRLSEMRLISELPPDSESDPNDHRYQPARPLANISLLEFRQLFENYGESPSGELLDNIDPALAQYHARLSTGLPQILGKMSLDELLIAYPLTGEPGSLIAPNAGIT